MRKLILQGTYLAFEKKKAALVTQDICDEAHVSKGTLFNYFETREQLMSEAFREAVLHAEEDIYAGIDPGGDMRQVLRQMLRGGMHWAETNRGEALFIVWYYRKLGVEFTDRESEELLRQRSGNPGVLEVYRRFFEAVPEEYRPYVSAGINRNGLSFIKHVAENPETVLPEGLVDYMADRLIAVVGQ